MNRDEKGRFIKGNTVSKLGWIGLVQKRFKGNYSIAKEWLRALGNYGYGRCYFHPIKGYPSFVKDCFKVKPSKPEEFIEEWQKKLDFKLSDCKELAF